MVEKKIIDILDSNEILSTSEIARQLNMRREVTAGYLDALADQGKLKKTKVGRSNVFIQLKNEKKVC
ncbi:hypothetical protein HYZ41_00305 [archaeon]|nr:hypothetical protein [archaeon]